MNMKIPPALSLLLWFTLFFLFLPHAVVQSWAVSERMNFQGKLTDSDGLPLNGVYGMRFSLFDAEIGGTQLWNAPDGEIHPAVMVSDGLYSIELGAIEPLNSAVFAGEGVWLEVAILNEDSGIWEIFSPRQRITSTAYAFRAGDAAALDGISSGDIALVDHDHDSVYSFVSHGHDADYVNVGEGNAVTSAMIVDGTVTADDLGVDAVRASEIAEASVGTSEIANGSVTAIDLADGAVLAEIIEDGGPGSGLNADFLDNYSSSDFMPAATDNWVNVAGDTMNGLLALRNGEGDSTIILNPDSSGVGRVTAEELIISGGAAGGFAADFTGNVRIRDGASGETVMELGAGLDYAEGFAVTDHAAVSPGSVLIIDPDRPGKLKLSDSAYDSKVAGIVAGANNLGSGVRLGAGRFDHDVALAGRVYCNVEATDHGVKTGDLLTTSDLPGFAMKAVDHDRARGAILGKAMENLDRGERKQILVLVTLQ